MAQEISNVHAARGAYAVPNGRGRARSLSLNLTFSLTNMVTVSVIQRTVRGERGSETRINAMEFHLPPGDLPDTLRLLQVAVELLQVQSAKAG